MQITEFILLLFIGNGELIEYTVRDGMTDCLKTKRVVERTMQMDGTDYKGSTIWSCKKLEVLVDKETGSIIEFTQGLPEKGGK